MALAKKQVDVDVEKARSLNYLGVSPVRANISRLATIAAAESPATVALTVAPTAGDVLVLSQVGMSSDTTDSKPLVHILAGAQHVDHYFQGAQALTFNLEANAGSIVCASVTGVQSVAHTFWMTAYEFDR